MLLYRLLFHSVCHFVNWMLIRLSFIVTYMKMCLCYNLLVLLMRNTHHLLAKFTTLSMVSFGCRAWFLRLSSFLLQLGFVNSKTFLNFFSLGEIQYSHILFMWTKAFLQAITKILCPIIEMLNQRF